MSLDDSTVAKRVSESLGNILSRTIDDYTNLELWSGLERHPYPEAWWAAEILARANGCGDLRCIGIDVPARSEGRTKGWFPDHLFEIIGEKSPLGSTRALLWMELKVASLTRFYSIGDGGRTVSAEFGKSLGPLLGRFLDVWDALLGLDICETSKHWEKNQGSNQLKNFTVEDQSWLVKRHAELEKCTHWIAACLIVQGVELKENKAHIRCGGDLVPLAERLEELEGRRNKGARGRWHLKMIDEEPVVVQRNGDLGTCFALRLGTRKEDAQ